MAHWSEDSQPLQIMTSKVEKFAQLQNLEINSSDIYLLQFPFFRTTRDAISIGTNDLIQYTMAVDRVNEYVSYLYEPLHPSLMRLIGDVARAAKEANIPVTVCGEMAGDPTIAPVLLGLGIREMSMSAVSVPEVKAAIRSMAVSETETLMVRIKKLPTAAEVRAMVSEYVFGLTGQRKGRA